jgi:hypothetical protein
VTTILNQRTNVLSAEDCLACIDCTEDTTNDVQVCDYHAGLNDGIAHTQIAVEQFLKGI